MSMWFIFRDDWSDLPSWSFFSFLAVIKFSLNQGPWFSRIHIHVLKSKHPEEYSTKILFHGVLRRYLSQNIDTITGTLWLNRFYIADSTGAHCWSQQYFLSITQLHINPCCCYKCIICDIPLIKCICTVAQLWDTVKPILSRHPRGML